MHRKVLFLIFLHIAFAYAEDYSFFSDGMVHLERLSKEFTLSNYSKQERDSNISNKELAYSVIKMVAENGAMTIPLKPYLTLAYKLANFLQQSGQPADAEIVLALSFKSLFQRFPQLPLLQVEEACELLSMEDPILPALYAALLHYQGKSVFYSYSLADKNSCLALSKAEDDLKQALKIRELIDHYPEKFQDLDDSNVGYYASHTVVFLRSLGYLFLEKEEIGSAQALYENILNSTSNGFEKMVAHLMLAKIYLYLASREWDRQQAYPLYAKSYEHLSLTSDYLKEKDYSGLLCIILTHVDFYCDPANPYYDLTKAKTFLENGIDENRSFSNHRTVKALKKLEELYKNITIQLEEKRLSLENKAEENYFATKVSPLGDVSLTQRVDSLIALASFYRKNQLFLQAGLLLSNALSKGDLLQQAEQERLWYELFLTEKEYVCSLYQQLRPHALFKFPQYRTWIGQHQNSLCSARSHYAQHLSSISPLGTHQALCEEIENVLKTCFKELFSLLQPISCSFAIVEFGSLAKEIPSPYSDFEFALIYSDSASMEEKERFHCLSTLFLLKLIALGETSVHWHYWPMPVVLDMTGLEAKNGLRADSGGMISSSFGGSYQLCGTVSDLQLLVCNLAVQMEFFKAKLLLGSEELFEQFKIESLKRLSHWKAEDKRKLFFKDLNTFIYPRIQVDARGQRFYSVKHTFLRGITLLLSHLASYHCISDASVQDVLNQLEKQQIISEIQKQKIESFLAQILWLRGKKDLESATQSFHISLNEENLSSFLTLAQTFENIVKELVILLPYKTEEEIITHPLHSRLRLLCRGGYLSLAKQEIEEELQTSKNSHALLEIRGDIALMEKNPSLAYEYYEKEMEIYPNYLLLNFKLAQAAIQADHLSCATSKLQIIEDQLYRNNLKNQNSEEKPTQSKTDSSSCFGIHCFDDQETIQTKLLFLHSVIARHECDWNRAEKMLSQISLETTAIVKKESLIHALIYLEWGYLYRHFGNLTAARNHAHSARDIVMRRYGPLHPAMLPIYEFLLPLLEISELKEKQLYSHRIAQIQELFPALQWMEALEASALD